MSKASYLAPKKIVRPQRGHEGLLRKAAKQFSNMPFEIVFLNPNFRWPADLIPEKC